MLGVRSPPREPEVEKGKTRMRMDNVLRGSPKSFREDEGAGLEAVLERDRWGFFKEMLLQLGPEEDLHEGRVGVALATQSEVKGQATHSEPLRNAERTASRTGTV